jgi:hypothetical protein
MASKIHRIDVAQVVLTAKPSVGKFLAINTADNLVTGCLLRSDQKDADGDRLTAAVIEKAEYDWAEAGGPRRPILLEHGGRPLRDGTVMTQWGLSPADAPLTIFGTAGTPIPPGAFFAQLQCGPVTLARIVKGELTGFSVEGTAVVKSLSDDEEFEIDATDLAYAVVAGIRQGLGLRPVTGRS